MAKMYVTACALAALAWAEGADAVTVTNRDAKEYKITVIEGEKSTDHVLKPSGVLEGICQRGCVVRLNDSENDEYELEGTEVVSIEEGYLYYDGPDAPAEQPPAEAGKGTAPADAGKKQDAPKK